MKAVYKYIIDDIRQLVCVDIPKGGKILSGGYTSGKHAIWALVDPDVERDYERVIFIAFTGDILPTEHTWIFIDSYTSNGLVYHTFEAL